MIFICRKRIKYYCECKKDDIIENIILQMQSE